MSPRTNRLRLAQAGYLDACDYGGGTGGGSTGTGDNGAGDSTTGDGFDQNAAANPSASMQQQTAPTNPSASAQPQTGVGVGVLAGVNAEAGVGAAGASVQGTAGVGVFASGSGVSAGGTATGAAVAYSGNNVAGAPSQQTDPFVLGGYAGYGPGFFITNAGSAQSLSGPFTTITANVGLFGISINISIGYSNGIGILSVFGGPAPFAAGVGLSGSTVTTSTAATGAPPPKRKP